MVQRYHFSAQMELDVAVLAVERLLVCSSGEVRRVIMEGYQRVFNLLGAYLLMFGAAADCFFRQIATIIHSYP